ncbi:MAG TPA: sensor histidine kinase [Woeseiaceae bacterium]|nr:sensor histidine kinase [Woeseiaceae bacterium]
MNRRRPPLRLLAALPLFVAAATGAQQDEAPSILILQSLDSQAAPYGAITQVFRARLQEHFDVPVSFAEVSLDARWGGRRDREPFQLQLIRNRAEFQRPDLVVNIGPAAIDFWERHRDELDLGVPALSNARESVLATMELRPGDAGVFAEWSIPRVIDSILELLPETREIVVVFGASELERAQTEEARRDLAGFTDRIRFHYTSDLSLTEIEALVSGLPPRSAVLVGILSIDAGGLIIPLQEGTERLVAASRAPVFSAFANELGLGVVGGRQIQIDRMSETMASTAAQMLTRPVADPIVRVVPLSGPTYDWRALKRWGIGAARLPPDSEVLFQAPSVWSQYAHWILLVVTVVAVQTFLLAALLLSRRRRRRAESASARLSSRLITAHEDERWRVARELHDDFSQRLAGLAIDAAMLAAERQAAPDPDMLKRMQSELVRISKDVHDMSYRLHPSIVGELGLVAAIRAETDRVRRLRRWRIDERIEPLRDAPPHDVALAIYRILQESLTNALKHADAASVRVRFRQSRNHYLLEVRDDGKGFDSRGRESETGIGLSGMRERARLAGGRLRVGSTPGKGTSIMAKIPVKGPVT